MNFRYYREYEKVIRNYQNETKDSDKKNFYFYYVIRPISILITPLFTIFNITANQITVFRFFAGVYLCIMVINGFNIFYSSIIYFGLFILDFVDGNIARMSKSKTLFGVMFDGWVDEIINLLFVISIAKSISDTHFIFSLGICLVKIISSYTQTRYMYLLNKKEKSVTNSINKKSNSFKKIASILMRNFENLNSYLITIFLILMVSLGQLSLWFFIYAIYLILFSTLTLFKTFLNSLKI